MYTKWPALTKVCTLSAVVHY